PTCGTSRGARASASRPRGNCWSASPMRAPPEESRTAVSLRSATRYEAPLSCSGTRVRRGAEGEGPPPPAHDPHPPPGRGPRPPRRPRRLAPPQLADPGLHQVGPLAAPQAAPPAPPGGAAAPAHPPGQALGDQDGEARDLVEVLRGERREVLVHEHLAVALAGHLEGLALLRALLLPVVEGQRAALLGPRRRRPPPLLVAGP